MGRIADVGTAISRARVEKAVADMRLKIDEIDDLRRELAQEHIEISPEKSMHMLEEIKVPSLEAIRLEKKKA